MFKNENFRDVKNFYFEQFFSDCLEYWETVGSGSGLSVSKRESAAVEKLNDNDPVKKEYDLLTWSIAKNIDLVDRMSESDECDPYDWRVEVEYVVNMRVRQKELLGLRAGEQ